MQEFPAVLHPSHTVWHLTKPIPLPCFISDESHSSPPWHMHYTPRPTSSWPATEFILPAAWTVLWYVLWCEQISLGSYCMLSRLLQESVTARSMSTCSVTWHSMSRHVDHSGAIQHFHLRGSWDTSWKKHIRHMALQIRSDSKKLR